MNAVLRWMWLPCLLTPLALAPAQETSHAAAEPVRGAARDPDGGPTANQRYRQSWALIVGVNDYTTANRSDAERVFLRKLNHAEKDATDVHRLLLDHYGYDAEHAILLCGPAATHQAILDQLTSLHDESKVHKDDSLLIFFAGHGARVEGDAYERGAIYPVDVQLSNGRPLGRYLGMHSDLLNKLKKSPARHKLIVLDCCHSGEIFSLEARPRSETDNRQLGSLFKQPAIQAIASCRASQTASDGREGHSPFTASLLRALTQLPARDKATEQTPIWTNKLFGYMRSELTSLPNEQSPDCRCLSGDDGEFYLFPEGDFSQYASHLTEFRLLQAMVPGEHGNWWFEETPWFLPSLRRMILEEGDKDGSRSSAESLAVSVDQLRELTDRAILKMRSGNDPLVAMRLRHLEPFLKGLSRDDLKRHLESIVAELSASTPSSAKGQVDATDLHFLAVVQHRLGNPAAQDAYRRALDAYAAEGQAKESPHHDALRALCHSDLGHYLLEVKSDNLSAAKEYQLALAPFGTTAPAAFRVYVLCREADAWQRLNRWGEANRKLLTALDVANNFDSQHGLTVFTLRRRAWSLMEQWKIAEAALAFEKANEVLAHRARNDGTGETVAGIAATEESLVTSGDFDALIVYLHNLHGLAMVKRFQGNEVAAAQEFRELTVKVAVALAKLRENSSATTAASDVENRLVERSINTQERLADCNLFGSPEVRDIKEAVDDYRRALSVVHLVPDYKRDRLRISLLFRQAIALSMSSSCQDLDLAQAYCREALELHKPIEASASEVQKTLAAVTPPMVALLSQTDAKADPSKNPLDDLRMAIESMRDRGSQDLHRDQLEILLYASKVLVDHVPAEDRRHLAEDSELLLSFCRLTLPKHAAAFASSAGERRETQAYLRPYYDAVLRNKLRLAPKHVKDLLEIQWEATRGESYLKAKVAVPVLALYVLDGKCHLFLDVPRGSSKHFCLEDDDGLDALRHACSLDGAKLPLPREIARELDKLRGEPAVNGTAKTTAVELTCWWIDPVRGLGDESTRVLQEVSSTGKPVERELRGSFPFQLPANVKEATGALPNRTTAGRLVAPGQR